MTTTNLGKVSVTPKGEYDPLITYERLDIVSHNGSSYIAKQASTGVTPIEGEFYALIAEKGDGGSFVKKAYKTYAAMDADKVNIPANSSVDVTNDLDESKNGAYIYDGVAFTRSQYDSKVVTDKIIADTAIAVQDAINNTAVDGGVLADTFVVVDGSLSQRTINKGLESIADLSTIKNPKDGLRVYVKSYHAGLNKGGGYFIFNSTRVSENDLGTVINGWERNSTGNLNIYMFGAKGDGVSNDTQPFQAFFDSDDITTIYVPEGVFMLDSIRISKSNKHIKGASRYSTSLIANIDPKGRNLFNIEPTEGLVYVRDIWFENFRMEGKNRVEGLIYGDKIAHFRLFGSSLVGCTGTAITLGFGWCNTIFNNRVGYCKNGIVTTSTDNNILNIINNVIGADEVGIGVSAALKVNISNNTIEQCQGAGIVASNVRGLTIVENYFEKNSSEGYNVFVGNASFDAEPVEHGHIILHAREQWNDNTSLIDSYACKAVTVENNTFSGGPINDSTDLTPVVAYAAHGLRISKSAFEQRPNILSSFIFRRHISTFRDIEITNNDIQTDIKPFIYRGEDSNSKTVNEFPLATIQGIYGSNLLKEFSHLDFKKTVGGSDANSTIKRSSNRIGGLETFEFNGRAAYELDLNNLHKNTDLKAGDLLSFSLTLMLPEVPEGTFIVLFLDNTSDATSTADMSIVQAGKPFKLSKIFKMPSDPFKLGIRCYFGGTDTNNKIIRIAEPVLTHVGAYKPYMGDFTPTFSSPSIPTEGYWSKGDTVYNSIRVTGSPIGWVCTRGSLASQGAGWIALPKYPTE